MAEIDTKIRLLMNHRHGRKYEESSVFSTLSRLHYVYTIYTYRQISNIKRTLVGNMIVDHSGVVGASPVGAAPSTSSFSI